MKQLVVLIEPNGVGKRTTARRFVENYVHSAYVDSDWCRFMNPFEFTETTIRTIK